MLTRSRALPVIVGVLSAVLFVRLGFWQLSRLHQRRAANAVASQARKGSPVDLNAPGAPRDSSLADRPVVVRGEYDRSREIVLRNHVYRDSPGVWLVTPLRIAGSDSVVLINRGFVPAPDAVTADLDSLNEPVKSRCAGWRCPSPLPPTAANRFPGWGSGAGSGWTSRRSAGDSPTRSWPCPSSRLRTARCLPAPSGWNPYPWTTAPHLSYAIQWFAFATIGLVGGILLARKAT
jgi:surfeit locus 1 family protein